MMIELSEEAVDTIVVHWLKDTLEMLDQEQANLRTHPDDKKSNKKLIKALKRLLEYTGVPE